MSDTIFGRIIRGEIPCHRVYQDEHLLAFLDIHPLCPGHTLVVPKEPAATLDALSDDAAAGLGRALPRVCRAVQKATGSSGYNVLINSGAAAGQEVPHAHAHVIPRYAGDGGGLDVRWVPIKASDEDLAEMGRLIARLC